MRPRYYLDHLPVDQAQRLLFRRLFCYMALDDADFPLSPPTMVILATLRDDILAGRVLTFDERAWRRLSNCARWDGSVARSPCSCGPGLLTFVNYLGKALQRFGPTKVPLHLALMALVRSEYDPGSTWLGQGADGHDVLQITGFGQGALGLHGGVDLGESLPDDPDAGQLFDSYFANTAALAAA